MTEHGILKTEEQRIGELALRTAQWWNASLWQFKRFLNAVEMPNEGNEPWDQNETSSLLRAESMFLITAIYQAINYLDLLQDKMQQHNDASLTDILSAVVTKAEQEQIRYWRNINEHERNYIQGKGTAQKKAKNPYAFLSDFFIGVTDHIIYINGHTKKFYLGRIQIDQLIARMMENHSVILQKTKEIFYNYYYGFSPQDESSYQPQEDNP
ncbi:hypothetical protein [Agathobaculum sp. Marseille-P7918]|uniref:hypothetical protein n=1 Tax=Agathobaculum sp. Marseille-P7918 TaxID=2479843 RepID=UPI0035683FE4